MASAAAHVTLPAQTGQVTGDMAYILRRRSTLQAANDEGRRAMLSNRGVDEDDVFHNKSPRSSGDRVATYISVQSVPIYP